MEDSNMFELSGNLIKNNAGEYFNFNRNKESYLRGFSCAARLSGIYKNMTYFDGPQVMLKSIEDSSDPWEKGYRDGVMSGFGK
jgi:hypothetical protein